MLLEPNIKDDNPDEFFQDDYSDDYIEQSGPGADKFDITKFEKAQTPHDLDAAIPQKRDRNHGY